MYLIGLDNGGTSTKAAVFDVNGNEVATAGRHTKLITPKPGYTERDMEELWLANCACVREALEKAGIDGKDVLGIAVCGHGKGKGQQARIQRHHFHRQPGLEVHEKVV